MKASEVRGKREETGRGGDLATEKHGRGGATEELVRKRENKLVVRGKKGERVK